MTPERWRQIRDVLEKALDLAPGERSAYLNQACSSDSSLRQEVDTLLASSDHVRSNFLLSTLPPVTLTPGTKLGEYEIVALVGSGGMGEVYRAKDTRLGRDVAIKVLPTFFAADVGRLRRFEQEARAAAALNHPNILAVFQMGTHQGAPYLVSELLEGETLRAQLKRGRLAVRKAIDYGVQIAQGLAVAHEKGIVHRDLKPENLFMTKNGRVKILDFGLAKLTQRHASSDPGALTLGVETEAGVVMGTVGYMAPEQVRGETADHRADIFAFGAILYEMLAGKRAFQKPTSPETMTAILNEDPPGISQVVTNIPPALQRVVHRCLEKSPEQRFQSASDLAFAMDALSDPSWQGVPAAASTNVAIASSARAVSPPKTGSYRKRLAAALSVVVFGAAITGWIIWKRKPLEVEQVTQRQLTANAVDNPINSAVISREGKYLAYSDDNGVTIEEIDNGDTHILRDTVGLKPVDWYSDGMHLLVRNDDGTLWSVFGLSGEKRKLAAQTTQATMSPDGSQIVFSRDRNELWTMPANGGEPQLRSSINQDGFFVDFDSSPDGKAVADIRFSKGYESGTLEIRDLRDGRARTLLTDQRLLGGGINTVCWLPDNRILFELYKGNINESDLWTLSLDSSGSPTGKPVRITNTVGTYFGGTTVSRDGKRLAVVSVRNSFPMFSANLGKAGDTLEHPLRLTNDSAWPRAWTLDGQTLFYSPIRGAGGRLNKRHLSPDFTELFASGQESYESAAASPDGAWLVVAARTGDKWQLLRVPISGGAPETILEPAGPAGVRCATAGSRICILSEFIGKQVVFSAVDPVRGRLEELARTDMLDQISSWNVSPDGASLAMVANLSDSVRVLDLKSKQVRVIRPSPPLTALQKVAWSADGRRLFISRFPYGGQLVEMDMDGHAHLLLENRHGWIGHPLPSPNGKWIAYIYAVRESNVTLFEHF